MVFPGQNAQRVCEQPGQQRRQREPCCGLGKVRRATPHDQQPWGGARAFVKSKILSCDRVVHNSFGLAAPSLNPNQTAIPQKRANTLLQMSINELDSSTFRPNREAGMKSTLSGFLRFF